MPNNQGSVFLLSPNPAWPLTPLHLHATRPALLLEGLMRCCGLLFAGLFSLAATAAAAQSADLAVTITNYGSQRLSGGISEYVIAVSNSGPDDASNVVLTNALPGALARLNLNSPAYGTCSPGAYNVPGETIVCNLPTLAAGQTAYFRFETVLSGSATGTVSNTVTVSSDTPDPDLANNAATDTDTIVAAPAAVPTLTEWAMILFGSLLAGGAALHLNRRRQVA